MWWQAVKAVLMVELEERSRHLGQREQCALHEWSRRLGCAGGLTAANTGSRPDKCREGFIMNGKESLAEKHGYRTRELIHTTWATQYTHRSSVVRN